MMARMTCKCGQTLSNSQAPNEVNLVVFTDTEWENICNRDHIQPWMIPLPKYDVWRCPTCERIYVFERGSNDAKIVYVKETADE